MKQNKTDAFNKIYFYIKICILLNIINISLSLSFSREKMFYILLIAFNNSIMFLFAEITLCNFIMLYISTWPADRKRIINYNG